MDNTLFDIPIDEPIPDPSGALNPEVNKLDNAPYISLCKNPFVQGHLRSIALAWSTSQDNDFLPRGPG